MKNFKRTLTVVLAVAVMFALSSIIAFAEAPTSGSVTVSPNFKDQTYTLYKLFDAKMTYDENGTLKAVTYQLPTGKTAADLTYGSGDTAKSWFEVDGNGNVKAKEGTDTDWAKDPDAIAWAKSFGSTVGSPKTATSDNDNAVKWESLNWGYYFVDTTTGSFIGVDTDNPNATIQDKNNLPSVDKEITSAKNGTVANDSNKTSETDKGKNEVAIAQVGDTIGYKLTVSAKPGAENYVVTDTLSEGLTPPNAGDVTVADLEAGADKDYTVSVSGQVITVTFTKKYLDTITEETDIVITYNATLNSDAVIGEAGNPNEVKLTWGHEGSENVNYSEDDAKVYTAQVSILKTDGSNDPLKGAGFVLKKGEKFYKLDNGEVTWVDSIDDADEHTSGEDGKVAAFTGLANGTYKLVEKTVPSGYNKAADTEFTISDSGYTDSNLKQTETVINQSGSTLPSTGGMGTRIFMIAGLILIAGAAITLVVRRRMQSE